MALAAANLKKAPAPGEAKKEIPIPKKGGPNKEESKEPPQVRTSNMDALKAQIMLRKQAMNPTGKKGGEEEEGKKGGNLAALSMKMSKFGQYDEDDEEESASSNSDDD